MSVARCSNAPIAFDTELTDWLDMLESAYHASGDICHLRERLDFGDEGCGTISLGPHQFVVLLKTMILNEHAALGLSRGSPAPFRPACEHV